MEGPESRCSLRSYDKVIREQEQKYLENIMIMNSFPAKKWSEHYQGRKGVFQKEALFQ